MSGSATWTGDSDWAYRRRKAAAGGFTLVELMVVISIISLLIALLLPALSKARMTARSAACLARLHNLSLAMHYYTPDYNEYLPPSHERSGGTDTQYWPRLLWPYVYSGTNRPLLKNHPKSYYETIFNCTETTGTDPSHHKNLGWIYTYNTWMKDINGNVINQNSNISARLTTIRKPSRVFLFVEEMSNNSDAWTYYTANSLAGSGADLLNHHAGSTNALFVDGHASAMSPADWPLTAAGEFAVERYQPQWTGD